MSPLEQSLEQQLAEEARQRELLHLYEKGDLRGLLAAAELLNTAYSQQLTISKWLAHEAADNLGEAWEAHHRKNHGQVR